MIPAEIIRYLESRYHIRTTHVLAGGDINRVYRIDTPAGDFCLKYNVPDLFPGMFEKEARGLTLLREAQKIRIPEVVDIITLEGHSALLLEFIHASEPRKDLMYRFGVSLAELHDLTGSVYGLDHDNYMGSLPQSNTGNTNWIDFFIEERLERQLSVARDSGCLSKETAVSFSRLFSRLDQLLVVDKPALLHGDLWGGNVIVSDTGDACLIDPAVYYGHREVDLAMTTLFGGFSPDFYRGYESSNKLAPGWRERLDIYNLYPLLVHANLFGGGYMSSVRRILQRFS